MIAAHVVEAFAKLLHLAINVFIVIIIIRALISWMGNVPPNAFIIMLRRLTDPVFRWVHRTFPFMIVGGIDISPIAICAALYFIDSVLYKTLIRYAMSLVPAAG